MQVANDSSWRILILVCVREVETFSHISAHKNARLSCTLDIICNRGAQHFGGFHLFYKTAVPLIGATVCHPKRDTNGLPPLS